MLVLSGKKLKNIVIGLFAVFMVVALTLGSKENNLNYIDTVSLPVSGKVVVIDAGHGIPDERSCLLTLKITLIFYKK